MTTSSPLFGLSPSALVALTMDPHSYYVPGQPRVQDINWSTTVDFDAHVLRCVATLYFDRTGTTALDTRDLEIETVTDSQGNPVNFDLGTPDPVLGTCLTVEVPDLCNVVIRYKTSPSASALQWLTPAQTLGGTHPYLFSQGQCIHTRSIVPCQDSPGIRITYTAQVTVPTELRCVMAASFLEREEHGDTATERWQMLQPIPSYLFAFAVGNLVSRDLDPRCRVWTEPELIEAAADEFTDVGAMVDAAEALFGAYDWERWDILVLPPSFPYGGMENPRLTFVTPTCIHGDRSGVSLLRHELAHSWTGNLITNADWRTFWLNEGWTTYAERRLGEAMSGRDVAMLEGRLLACEFVRDCETRFAADGTPQFTWLAMPMPGDVDPDDTFSRVPYFKGAMFIMALELCVGREMFDRFIRKYIESFRFTSITTATFLDFVAAELPGVLEKVQAWRWLFEPWLPANTPEISSPLITVVEEYALKSAAPPATVTWDAHQWVLYLGMLPQPLTRELIDELEGLHRLTQHNHRDVRWAYLVAAIEAGVDPTTLPLEDFIAGTGRLKHLRPLLTALAKQHRPLVVEIVNSWRERWHPTMLKVAEGILAKSA